MGPSASRTSRPSAVSPSCSGRWRLAPACSGPSTRWARLSCAASLACVGTLEPPPGLLEHVKFHEETTDLVENFCGVPGLTVQRNRVVDRKVLVNARGPDVPAFLLDHETLTEVFTNLANGTAVTLEFTSVRHSLSVTDHGDGTYTALFMETGNSVAYGPDGKALARDTGQRRTELLRDDAGTPADPLDDVTLSFRVVKESTGRNDDVLCATTVPVLIG